MSILIDSELYKKRLQVCKTCEHFIKISQQCKICMCIMPLKAKIKSSTCPKGKWY